MRSRRSSSCSGELLDDADGGGRLRPGLDRRRITGVVLQATMFNAFAATISGRRAYRRRCGIRRAVGSAGARRRRMTSERSIQYFRSTGGGTWGSDGRG